VQHRFDLAHQRRGVADVGVEPRHHLEIEEVDRAPAQPRQRREAQRPLGAGQYADRPAREGLGAAESARHGLRKDPGLGSQKRRRLHAQSGPQMLVHCPLADGVRDVRHVDDAPLVFGDEAVVRDHVGQQMARVTHGDCTLLIPAGDREPAQRGPLVGAPERRQPDHAAGEREIRQAGAGEHEARQPQRYRADPRIGEGCCGKQPLREKNVRLQSPRQRVGSKKQNKQQETDPHGPASFAPCVTAL